MTLTLYQILSLIGVPSLFTIIGFMIGKMKSTKSEVVALKLGIQALLRAQLINDWNKWSVKGYAPIYARENFENVWTQYHALGANGVMNDIHDKFLDLPTQKPNEEG